MQRLHNEWIMKPSLATESFCLLAISPSCTHYHCTCFTCLPGALVSSWQSPDSPCLLAQPQEEESVGGGGVRTHFISLSLLMKPVTYTQTHTSIRWTEPLPPIHRLFHRHELGMRFVPSENACGRWGKTEAVRKKHPGGHQQPTPEYLPHISNTHIPSGCLPHINSPYSVCVCVCAVVTVVVCSGNMGSVPSRHRKKWLI